MIFINHSELINEIYQTPYFTSYEYIVITTELCGHECETKYFYEWVNEDGVTHISKWLSRGNTKLGSEFKVKNRLTTVLAPSTAQAISSRTSSVSIGDIISTTCGGMYKVYHFIKFH
jgi:hypothetical protein